MLSRSNTTASDRLRCARSSASMRAARQRSSATSDPLIGRQHAEAAATQAYRRARPAEQTVYPDHRPAPPMLQRRRSQVTGRAEGSHLEEARLGRRRSTVRHDENKAIPSTRPKPAQGSDHSPSKQAYPRNRRPASAQPHPDIKAAHRKERIIPTSEDYQRKTPSATTNGSPAPRSVSAVSGLNHTSLAPPSRYTDKSYDDGISVTYSEPQTYAERTKDRPDFHARRVSIRETQTDDEIIGLARDRRLQDSQQCKVRERKSFFGSFQKLQRRNVTEHPTTSGITYDTSLPPFNYADDSTIIPLPPSHDMGSSTMTSETVTKSERKSRMFSSSVKVQFKKLLRKTSRAPSGLLSQHTEAKHHSHAILDEEKPSRMQSSPAPSDPFVVVCDPSAYLNHDADVLFQSSDIGSNVSIGVASAADRSRVTSWTDSTAGGTTSTYANIASTSVADEHGRLQRSNSSSALRKKGSFFGRPIQNRLRKSSHVNLNGSEDSQALFTALRERILPHECRNKRREEPAIGNSQSSRTSSALSSLPSQRRSDLLNPPGHGKVSSIRTVSPDPDAFKVPNMSPVVEASPDRLVTSEETDDTPTVKSHASKRKTAPRLAAPLSPERIARRVQQSQTRWQNTLQSFSVTQDGKMSSAYDKDNPYELPSLRHNPCHGPNFDTGGLPHHTRVAAPAGAAGERLLSPSVYSRATDGASPRPATPEEGGMMVTITSREVKRYEISPPKKDASVPQRPVQASNEWRKWWSEEMTSLADHGDINSLTLEQDQHAGTAISGIDGPSRPRAATNGSSSQRKSSETPTSDQTSKIGRESRPRPSSRRSTYMNERYPMIGSSDCSSRRTSRKFSTTSKNGTDTERSVRAPGSDDSKRSVEGAVAYNAPVVSKSLPKRHSLAHLESSSQVKSGPAFTPSDNNVTSNASSRPATTHHQDPSMISHVRPPTTYHKHKSAFDLHANYKSSNNSTSRPVEVRRKTTTTASTAPITIFDDTTLQNISAGPYARDPYNNHRENTPPHADSNGNLPALSSSEWLAGPKRANPPAATRPKSSPPKVADGLPATGNNGREGSPGQRMVTGWLEGRKVSSVEGEVAFV